MEMQLLQAEDSPRRRQSAQEKSGPIAQFFVPAAASLQERRPRTLKHADTFAMFDHNGDAIFGPGSPEGVFHLDTRHLSSLLLTIEGRRPLLLSSTVRDDNATLTCDLSNPDIVGDDGSVVLVNDLIHIRRSRFLWEGTCFERLALRNFDDRPRRVRLGIAFAADFADLFEVRGTVRQRRGSIHPPEVADDSVTLSYTGLDDRKRWTLLRFDPTPARLDGEAAIFELDLPPRRVQSIILEIGCDRPPAQGGLRTSFYRAMRDARRAQRRSSSRAAAISTSNDIFNEAARRSVSDLYMLMTDTPEGPYPYAGIPWFSTVFGRDALITALETLWLDSSIARGVLGHLSANQADRIDPEADAEPGKILHEVRRGEMAELGEVPFRRYYGSIDSTPLFVTLAGAYLERTGDAEFMAELWPSLVSALDWIERYGDRDGDGFVEYHRQTEAGLANQGWKDSHDSIFHADGSMAEGPIALVEVQAYVYGAWTAAALIAERLGLGEQAQRFALRAETLKHRFDEAFFDGDIGTYVLALDGDKRPCRVRSSNAGHALLTGIAYPERAAEVARSLMAGPSFAGWGVRTVASTEARYNPMSYHNGSVWPHDNALIAAGLSRYGYRAEAARIFEGLFAASIYIDLRRLPELFCGLSRRRGQGPTFYPVACIPQAWAAAAPLSMIQSCLGLGFNAEGNHITFDEPVLPEFLDEVVLHRLRLGGGWADVALRRSGRKVVVHVLGRGGPVRVLTTN
jgi:glycogen debranching enzyme